MSDCFAITGEFSIYRAAELAQALHAWLPQAAEHGCVALDLSEVTEMDSSGLQLLLSTQRSAQNLQLPFTLKAVSPDVTEVLQLAALGHLLPSAPEL